MKKKVSVVIMCLTLAYLMVGCGGKGLSGKEAATVFMDAEFYGKEIETYKEHFGVEIDNMEEDIKAGLTFSLGGIGISDDVLTKVAKDMMTAIQDKTSFEVTETKEVGEETVATIAIKGLDLEGVTTKATEASTEAIVSILKEKGFDIEHLEDLAELEEEQATEGVEVMQDPEIMTQMLDTVLPQLMTNIEPSKESKNVEVTLVKHKDIKHGWEIKDRDATILQLVSVYLSVY